MSDLLIELAEAVANYENKAQKTELWDTIYKYATTTQGWTPADLFDYGYEAAKEMGLIK